MYKIENGQILNTVTGCLVDKNPESKEYTEFLLWYVENHALVNNPVPQVETRDQLTARLRAEVEGVLNSRAQFYGYQNMLEACTYADEPAVPKYQLEGRALRRWRSLVWYWFEQQLATTQPGTKAATFLERMPQFTAPETGVVAVAFKQR